jgi:hypothetical protein
MHSIRRGQTSNGQGCGFQRTNGQELNKALFIDPVLNNIFEREEWNEEGVYRHTVTLFRKSRVRFYYVAKNGEVPPYSDDDNDWVDYYNNNKIVKSKRKELANEEETDAAINQQSRIDRGRSSMSQRRRGSSNNPGGRRRSLRLSMNRGDINPGGRRRSLRLSMNRGDINRGPGAAIITPDAESAGPGTRSFERLYDDDDYFDDGRMSRVFGGKAHDKGSTRKRIETMIEKLVEAENDYDKLEQLINKIDEAPITPNQVLKSIQKIQYLRRAYEKALVHMPQGVSWYVCCQKSIDIMTASGVIGGIKSTRTIATWNVYFRKNFLLPHPNVFVELDIERGPKLFQLIPEAKETFVAWANENLVELNGVNAACYLHDELIPELYNKENESLCPDDKISYEAYLGRFNLKSLCPQTALNWLQTSGFKFSATKKCYFNDKHENEENKAARTPFTEDYFRFERLSYRWIQIPVDVAEALEREEDPKKEKLLKDIWSFEFTDDESGNKWREYHVDCLPETTTNTYIKPEYKLFGGNLSRHFPEGETPVLMSGQDESAYKQFIFSSKSWKGSDGIQPLLPKDDGLGLMCSAFVSRVWGFMVDGGNFLTSEMLQAINQRRRDPRFRNYLSTDAAIEINGSTVKKDIVDTAPFCRFFEYGADKEGYWNFNHMALQLEDLVDCCMEMYPGHDFVFIFDQSSGHGKQQKDGLNALSMNSDYGGAVPDMHETTITADCLGPFPKQLQAGAKQSMIFQDTDQGPFQLNKKLQTPEQRSARKQDRETGNINQREARSKKELLEKLKAETGEDFGTAYRRLEELKEICKEKNISTKVAIKEVESGWLAKPKGLFQVLWERGWIDESKLSQYVKDKRREWLDKDGNVKEEHVETYKKYSLRYLLSECPDFKYEKSAMEKLCMDLSLQNNRKFDVLVSPKYHCELAGDGIECGWGYSKKTYRRYPLKEKRTKKQFEEKVKESLRSVSIQTMRRFSARARRYMLTYRLYDNQADYADFESAGLCFSQIEKHVNSTLKTHQNAFDQQKGYICQVWRESQQKH